MSKRRSKHSPRSTRQKPNNQYFYEEDIRPGLVVKKSLTPLVAKTSKQKQYIDAIRNFTVTFGIGPAGSGKTYIAGSIAAQMLESKQIEKIYITRPAVEAGENLGFLPGELEDKYAPYIAAIRQVLDERLGKSYVDLLIERGVIEAAPLAYLRGMTFKNCIAILDEAQNCTKTQLKLFLTRIGENCKVIVDGDPSQVDIKESGLEEVISKISFIPTIKVVNFSNTDIVRSGLVQEIVEAL